MKQIVLLLIALFVPAGILQAEPDTYWANNAATQFAGGNGESAETAYIISTAAELAFFANEFNAGKGDTYRGKYFKLDPADDTDYIDLAAHLWRPVGSTLDNNTAFQGHFDGGGCTIRNIQRIGGYQVMGFFGCLKGSNDFPVTIQNLNLSDGAIQGMTDNNSYTGALAAAAFGTITLKNCAVDGMAITGGSRYSSTGGLIGWAYEVNLTMQSCAVRTNIQGGGTQNSYTGGLVGELNGTLTLTDSYFQGIIIGGESATIYNSTGGLVGWVSGNSTFKATNSYVSGQVIGGKSGYLATGGLVGYGDSNSSLSFTHCLAVLEDLSGPDGSAIRRIIGDKGDDVTSTITNTYASVETNNWIDHATDNGTNWDGNLSGQPILSWNTDNIWVKDPTGQTLPDLRGLFFYQGTGTINDPYLISGPTKLNRVRYALDKHYRMSQDINLSKRLGSSKAPGEIYGAAGWLPIGNWDAAFTGTFDGGGFTISGLWINREETILVGLFGYIGGESIIKNLTVEIPEGEVVKGDGHVAGLLGSGDSNTTLQDCRVTGGGTVTGNTEIGGLVGYMHGSILRSAATVEVSGKNHIGGLVGTLHNGSATQSYATGQVTVSNDTGAGGGLAGDLNSGSLFQCYALGDIEGTGNNPRIGGLVGSQDGSITQCYAAGEVDTGNGYRGGLSGERGDGRPLNTSFYNITENQALSGVGFGDSNGATGITTEEMQKRATFLAAGWTFNQANWSIREGEAFPHFSWEEWDGYPPATTLHSIWLEVGAGITVNHQAGELLITEEDHLFLNFWADEAGITSDDILLWIDGVETAFTPTIGNRGGSYILNPPTAAQAIVIALRQYTVTLPTLPEGFTLTPGAGNHRVDYGKPFQFTVTANDPEALNGLKICINGVELQPDANGQYTIDSVTGPITITIEGFDTTANARLAEGEVTLSVVNNQLYMVNTTDRPVPVAVYNLTGKNIVSLPALRGSQTITLPAGIYLVRTGQTRTKLLIP
ncbi:T9SS type A sorting domain-containing protein [Parabacteroides sp. PF5-6]|uniref:T9SS type A sorting domain-containing protein n=1 Tax=Parabacteroides sp. PF5-6 TaxID=1742403 RepID=UPI002404AB8F|nr:T9SS type A sorting domain-containing protein [Parabacteroides sp. PF5-6]MDF9829921.1 hypothetical protein [Parabacteroides sp. PF5-6]